MLDATDIQRRFAAALHNKPGLRLKDIADACEVTPQAVGDWKRTGRIDKRHFQALAQVMDTSLAYWFGDAAVTAPAAPSSADVLALVESLAVAQTLTAQAMAESIPTAGRALVDALTRLDPALRDRDYLVTLLGTLRRELASQDAAAQHKVPGSGGRKRP